MSRVFIVDLEAVETRYTSEWKEHLPNQLQQTLVSDTLILAEVDEISGGDTPQATTPGAFLNFGGTNVYKSNQLMQIGEMFCKGEVQDGDYFLYTDAWNPTVIQLKYMAELLGIKIQIGGMWHAGSYDPADFLGRLIGDADWCRHAERSMFSCYDQNFFASNFHIEMFGKALGTADVATDYWINTLKNRGKIVRCGWPMEYEEIQMTPYKGMDKRNLILFPHRVAPEKQPDIFRDLAEQLPEYEFVMCQEQGYSKNEYHNALGEAKVVFSANTQETLGISWYEGALVDTIPIVPDRLSYKEMGIEEFKYPSEWTVDFDKYMEHRDEVVELVRDRVENHTKYLPLINKQVTVLKDDFFSGKELYKTIKHCIGY